MKVNLFGWLDSIVLDYFCGNTCNVILMLLVFRFTISIRDLLSWVMFINATVNYTMIDHADRPFVTPEEAYIHGACLIFIDAIGSGNTAFSGKRQADVVKRECIDFLCAQVDIKDFVVCNKSYINTVAEFGIHPFLVEKG